MSSATYKGAKWVGEKYGVSPSTLRSWANKGMLQFIRTPGSGKRLYDTVQLQQLLKVGDTSAPKGLIYVRVASSKQKLELKRQVDELSLVYPAHEVVTDVASGIDLQRPGLLKVIDSVNQGIVQEVVVYHRDALSRIAIDLIEHLFRQKCVKLVLHSKSDEAADSPEQLAEDLGEVAKILAPKGTSTEQDAELKRGRDEEGDFEEGNKAPRLETDEYPETVNVS